MAGCLMQEASVWARIVTKSGDGLVGGIPCAVAQYIWTHATRLPGWGAGDKGSQAKGLPGMKRMITGRD